MPARKEDWQAQHWPIVLSQPPVVVQMGIGVHGVSGTPSTERYRLPDLWCLHLYNYEAQVTIGGKRFPIRPGYMSIIPPDTTMTYQFSGRVVHLYCHFRCAPRGPETSVSAMRELGDDFAAIYRRFHDVAGSVGIALEQRQAMLWDLLWRQTETPEWIPDKSSADSPQRHPAVEKSLRRIEQHLAEPLTIKELAKESGVSYSYLARLFHQAIDTTVVGYIRRRRVERAVHLLQHSTLSIKSIAAAVGIPDLHSFNKVMRQIRGKSPRQIRSSSDG